MFLFFMIILLTFMWFKNLIGGWQYDRKSKREAIARGRKSYVNRYGGMSEVDTDIPYRIWQEVGEMVPGYGYVQGDIVKKHAHTGQVLVNYTQEKRDKVAAERQAARAQAIARGQEFYVYEVPQPWYGLTSPTTYQEDPRGHLPKAPRMWADVKTGTRYFVYTDSVNFTKYASLWNVDTKKIEYILDGHKYSDEVFETINDMAKRLNESKFFNTDRGFQTDIDPNTYRVA